MRQELFKYEIRVRKEIDTSINITNANYNNPSFKEIEVNNTNICQSYRALVYIGELYMYFLTTSFEHIFKKNNIIPILKIRKLKIKQDKSNACQNLNSKLDLKSMFSLLLQVFIPVNGLM